MSADQTLGPVRPAFLADGSSCGLATAGPRHLAAVAFTTITFFIFSLTLYAQSPPPQPPAVPDTVTPQKSTLNITPDESTGAFIYDFPVTAPPGRLGIQPNLSLEYNSQNQDNSSIFGYGWSINIPFIGRRNLHGTDQLYASLDFFSSLSGDLTPATASTSNSKILICAARAENGDFLKYNFDSTENIWTVQDKKGWTYLFGATANSRQDDPNDATRVYRWYLSSLADSHGNFMQYSYFKDQGQIYPDAITYTGDNSGQGIYSVQFSRTSRDFDKMTSFASGFRVQTNEVVSQIQVQLQGKAIRTYALNHAAFGSNQSRTMLSSIQETGFNPASNTTITLPATTLSYSGNSSNSWWQQSKDWSFSGPNLNPAAVRIADVNGDGLADLIVSYEIEGSPDPTQNGVVKQVWLNNGHSWVLSSGWTIPIIFEFSNRNTGSGFTSPAEFIDVNGDGKADIIVCNSFNNPPQVFINNGHGWDDASSIWIFAPCVLPGNNGGTSLALGDLNGDGLPDYLFANQQAIPGTPGQTMITSNAWVNTGSGWQENKVLETNTTPVAFIDPGLFDTGTRLMDVNGDGLADLVKSGGSDGVTTAYLNSGSGAWQNEPSFKPLQIFSDFHTTVPPFARSSIGPVFDINNDGLQDYGPCMLNTGTGYININPTGSGSAPCFDQAGGSPLPSFGGFSGDSELLVPADVNGDGLTDLVSMGCADFICKASVFLNMAGKPDLLNTITNSFGGTITVSYAPSAQYRNSDGSLANPNLPSVIYTVQEITATDPVNNVSKTTSYLYSGGQYFYDGPFDRKFSGFSQVAATDSEGNQTVTTFLQADPSQNPPAGTANAYNHTESLIGKVAKIEVFDASGNLFTRTVNTWSIVNLGAFQDFPELSQALIMSFDGSSSHKDKAEAYIYDKATGNLTQKTEFGEVLGKNDGSFTDTGNDKFTTTYSYASDSKTIVGLPNDITVTDQGGNKIKETKYFYDGKPFGTVTIGNITEEDRWESGSSFAKTLKSYTDDGLVKTITDPRGNITTFEPDSFNLYPATVTNALKQATKYTYDYAAGKVAQKTDPNNFVFGYTYDGLGRITQESQPDLNDQSKSFVETSYSYTDSAAAESSQRSDFLDAKNSTDTFRYFDGFGRLIQERKSAEDSKKFNVRDFAFDNRGLLSAESLPYVSDGSAKTGPTTTAALFITYSHDTLGRVTSIANAVGTTTNTYAPWQVTVTDANNHAKDLFKDAYDNLAKVQEHNGSNTYTTTYSYDGLKDLAKITDANGNVRNFTYDGLGRRLTCEDLHTSKSTAFGLWSYSYDDHVNLTKKVDPNNNIVNYSLDSLNRLTQESLGATMPDVQANYAYDTCSNGIGHLCSVENSLVKTSNNYNALGLLSAEIKTINGVDYETDYQYDPQGHETLITNPDGSQVQYTYNLAGLVETVFHKETSDAAFSPVVSNFDYSPLGKVAMASFANGAVTTNTYNASKLYRLTHKVTTLPASGGAGSNVQDISYVYDPAGNIISVTDKSSTNTAKNIVYGYDNLNRLTSYTVSGAANNNNHSETYAYDPIGNIITKSDQAAYGYAGTGFPNPDAVTSIGSTNYTYDSNGNLQTTSTGITNSWDYNNRLVKQVFTSEIPPSSKPRP